jgi:hypothetical protein
MLSYSKKGQILEYNLVRPLIYLGCQMTLAFLWGIAKGMGFE